MTGTGKLGPVFACIVYTDTGLRVPHEAGFRVMTDN